MPPPSMTAENSRVSNSTGSNAYAQLPKIFLLVLVVATGIRLSVLHYTRRNRRTPTPCQHVQEEKDSKSCQDEDLRQDRWPQSKDQLAPTFRPIYPWTSPPQPLPGPYDPRFYPLPTIRRHSYDPSHGPKIEAEVEAEAESHAISYTRRVSTNSLPVQNSTLRGEITISSNGTTGWRRNQWAVSGG